MVIKASIAQRIPQEVQGRLHLNSLLYLIVHKKLHITLGFGSIAGGLDHVNPVIRLPLKHGINREQVEKGIIELYFVRTEYQLVDMFTKALPEDRFKYLVSSANLNNSGIIFLQQWELSSLAVGTSSGSGNSITSSGNALFVSRKYHDQHGLLRRRLQSQSLLASPTQAWLWHQRLSHLNFNYINLLSKKDVVIGLPKLKYAKDQLCSSCKVSKEKRSSFKTKVVPNSKGRLNLLHMDLCGLMRVASINGKKYILSTEFLNKTLHAYFKEEGIEHKNSTLRTPEQNGIVERQNPAFYTQNRSIIILTQEKTAYHIINDRKPSIRHLHIFGCTCYLTRDGENLDKMKEQGDPYILVGYSTQSKGYRVYNKKTLLIVESIHHRFNEIKEMFDTVNKSSSPIKNFKQDDTPPTTNIQSSTEPTTPIKVNAEENNDNQAVDAHVQQDEFINPFCTPDDGIDFEESQLLAWKLFGFSSPTLHTNGFVDPDHPKKLPSKESSIWIETSSESLDFRSNTPHKVSLLTRPSDNLVSRVPKKQDCTAMSSVEAEYVALSVSCAPLHYNVISRSGAPGVICMLCSSNVDEDTE
uniref:Uncharacterized protein n=1 Tax=Tanacetum cinerariifolium TaxID=118510 RepID=A0A6L2MD08_TANCI|nr:hypothetical protein [Tanacetum cinerariifolium]